MVYYQNRAERESHGVEQKQNIRRFAQDVLRPLKKFRNVLSYFLLLSSFLLLSNILFSLTHETQSSIPHLLMIPRSRDGWNYASLV